MDHRSKALIPSNRFPKSLRHAVVPFLAATVTLALVIAVIVSRSARGEGLPDLTADGWLDHEPLIEGYPYLLTLAIKNAGEAAAGNFTVLMQYSGYGGPELVDIPASNPLIPGETRILRYSNITGSQGTAGFGIFVDYYGVVDESSESNNQVSRLWDGISPYERPYIQVPVYGNGTKIERLSPESAWIYRVALLPGDRFRYRVTGSDPAQPFDVFVFLGETNLNTYFGFGDLHPERRHDDVTIAEGEFPLPRNDTVYLVVDNLSDGPYPPWPRALNVTASIEMQLAPRDASATDPLFVDTLLAVGAIVGLGVAGVLAVAVYMIRTARRSARSVPAAGPHLVVCPSCGTPVMFPSRFCGRCGTPLRPHPPQGNAPRR